MEEDKKAVDSQEVDSGDERLLDRRDFLDGLGKWSKIVIGAAVFGGACFGADDEAEARSAWGNQGGGGGGWANRGGGGRGWANGSGGSAGWANRGGGSAGWANRGGGSAGWVNRGAGWANHGGSWVNRY